MYAIRSYYAMFQPVLRQITEGGSLCYLDLAAIRRDTSGEHFEQRGFPGAVFAAQSDAVPRPDVPIDAGEDAPVGKIFDDVFQLP